MVCQCAYKKIKQEGASPLGAGTAIYAQNGAVILMGITAPFWAKIILGRYSALLLYPFSRPEYVVMVNNQTSHARQQIFPLYYYTVITGTQQHCYSNPVSGCT